MERIEMSQQERDWLDWLKRALRKAQTGPSRRDRRSRLVSPSVDGPPTISENQMEKERLPARLRSE